VSKKIAVGCYCDVPIAIGRGTSEVPISYNTRP